MRDDEEYYSKPSCMQASREGFVQLLYAIILLQFGVIAVLLGGFSSEYLSNIFFRTWVNTTYPWLGPMLEGQMDALLVGVAAGATFLLIQRFRHEIKLGQATSRSDESSMIQNRLEDAAVSSDNGTNSGSLDSPNEVLAELERQDTI
jgi:hypothetical protein